MISQSEVLLSNCLSGGEAMVRRQQDLRLELSVCWAILGKQVQEK